MGSRRCTRSASRGGTVVSHSATTWCRGTLSIGKPAKDTGSYTQLVDFLYFLFRESLGQRLATVPQSFVDVNTLRTDLQHDVDHGEAGKIRAKRKKIGDTFEKYAGVKTPQLLDPERFVLVQANVLSAIELDLTNLAVP